MFWESEYIVLTYFDTFETIGASLMTGLLWLSCK